MSCNCNFGDTLHYVSPAHGGWGLVRIAALIPESHQLFVAPFACGRHGALGGELNGIKNRISYLYIDESDIVSGGYEDLIPDAVGELIDNLEKKPKVILIFVTCLDDLLGTDHVQLNKRLSKRYPDVRFMSCHMNPISENMKFPPGISMQNNLYSLLDPVEEKENAVNFIGNHSPVDADCELFEIMKKNGFDIHHITDFERFEEYQKMAKSRLNLVLSPVAKYASEQMKERLDIDYLLAYNTYDLKEIKEFYQSLEERLGLNIDITKYEKHAKEKIQKAREVIGDYPIALDYQAVKKPFTLAKALLEYGFQVKFIMAESIKGIERPAYEFIAENYKDITIVNAVHPELVKNQYRNDEDNLCIGFDCGYATGSRKVINLMLDEFLFGYYGVEQLMEKMIQAYEQGTDVKEMIEEAHLII